MNRKPYNLTEYGKWKSSEVKLFLLFYAIPIFRAYLEPKYFNVLASYVIAIRLLYEPSREIDRQLAQDLIQQYIIEIGNYFGGDDAYDYTIHAHVHLADEVRQHGPLQSHSLFFFEVNI
jgi:hypothetical protein